jgi:ABC-type Co2+ transport system permease subunit
MSDSNKEFRDQLLNVQEMSPSLRRTYQEQLDTLLQPPLTKRSGIIGGVLAVGLLVTVGLIIRADVFHHVRGLMLVGHLALAAGFCGAAVLMLRDLRKRKSSPRSVYSVSAILTWSAGALTVVALMAGVRNSSDPKSLFNAFYVFVFYFACAMWALESRIATSELSAREQSLRIECRLADLAERMQK